MNKNILSSLYRHGVQLMAVGIVTGIFAGVVVTFFNIAAELFSKYSKDLYALVRENPAFVPLLFAALAIIAFSLATVAKLVPMVRGSGIPQAEGAARGLLELKWYASLPAMAASCLVCILSGLTAGSEGPSMFIGANCGEGTSKLLRCTDMEKRYQITGGACAGLAVAFNAPLTGITFAFEEAHRRFTPAIFICAFSSVLSAIITRNALYGWMNMPVEATLSSFTLVQIPLKSYGFVALAAVASGLCGFGFYNLCLLSKKLFSKIKTKNPLTTTYLKLLFPFLCAGAFGLISASVMGGGSSFIESLGTHGGEVSQNVATIFSSPVVVTLILILIMRVVSTALNLGAGVSCGIFIPMLAIGACVGTLVSKLGIVWGMSAQYADCIVMICMATFFATIVKAPLTAIIMVVELTWQFTLLVPVVLGVSFGYMVSEVFGARSIYDELLDSILEEHHVHLTRRTYVTSVEDGSIAMRKSIRDVLWPNNLLIRSIKRDGVSIVPSSDTVLQVGDELSIQADCVDFEKFKVSVDEIVKPRKRFFGGKSRKSESDDKTE